MDMTLSDGERLCCVACIRHMLVFSLLKSDLALFWIRQTPSFPPFSQVKRIVYTSMPASSTYDPFDPHSVPPKGSAHPQKTKQLQSQLDEVTEIMQKNIQTVLDRGEHLQNIQQKSQDLEQGATVFQTSSNRVRRKMWWQSMKLTLIIIAVVIVLLLVIILPIVFSHNNTNQPQQPAK